ncbi:hypothetical protein GCM10023226_13820 [Nocardioides nanhaiensis]|uniref:DUF3558 domain-containing protein n=1 Tax=Nocardioides nanhaiensis TaxID=1476871 RepID=A0ABP8W0Y6_9ACTN
MAVVLVLVAGVVLGVVLLGGDDDAPDEPAAGPATPTSTPLADYDTLAVAVAREPFCEAVEPAVVTEVLEAEPTGVRTWADGEQVRLPEGGRDVAHEFGCRWAVDGAVASAWVFAPPVTRRQAIDLAQVAQSADGCAPMRGARPYGLPTLAAFCRVEGRRGAPAGTEASYRGLFGDAWLTCTLEVPGASPDEALAERAGRFCVSVLEAARLPGDYTRADPAADGPDGSPSPSIG